MRARDLLAFIVMTVALCAGAPPAGAQLPPPLGCWSTACPEIPILYEYSELDAIAADDLGRVFVGYDKRYIRRFGPSGDCQIGWRPRANDAVADLFTWSDAAVGPNGVIYFVQSAYTNHIYKYTLNGDSLLGWGRQGSGSNTDPGTFITISGLGTDALGYVYVSDYYQQRVQKFDANGTFISEWPTGAFPVDLAVSDSGYVFLAMSPNQVKKFTSNGVLVKTWGEPGYDPGQLDHIGLIKADHSGRLFINCSRSGVGYERTNVFTTSGEFLYELPRDGHLVVAVDGQNNIFTSSVPPGAELCKYGSGSIPARRATWGQVKTHYR